MLKNKLINAQEKIRKLTKRNKEQTDELNILQNTIRTKQILANNTPRNDLEVNELRTNLTVTK